MNLLELVDAVQGRKKSLKGIKFLTIREAAAEIGIDPRFLRTRVDSGLIPCKRFPGDAKGTRLIHRNDVIQIKRALELGE